VLVMGYLIPEEEWAPRQAACGHSAGHSSSPTALFLLLIAWGLTMANVLFTDHRCLKGIVSRDGGRGKALEWLISPKLRFANPLFPFKNPSSQCYGLSSRAPIDVKKCNQIRRNLLRFGVQFRFRVWVYRIMILASISCSHDQWASSCTWIG
jgi:hypothetical protein